MSMHLIDDKKEWDRFVDSSPQGMLFHKWDYLETMAEFTGYSLERHGIYNGDKLIALFPIFSKSSFGLKTLFSPPPQTGVPYLGFIMGREYNSLKQDKKEKQLSIVGDCFNKMVKERNFNYIFISLIPNFLDVREFKWNFYDTNMSYTYSIDLSQSCDEIFNGFEKSVRRVIKIASSSNLILDKCNNLSLFYSMETKRYGEQGLNFPLVSQKYLEKLLSLYPENLILYSLYDNERNLITSSLNHEYNYQMLLLMGGTKSKENIGGNEYIMWELIKKAKAENYKYFDIVGANNKNLCNFKSQFNPTLDFTYSIKKQDVRGRLAEALYTQFIKKK